MTVDKGGETAREFLRRQFEGFNCECHSWEDAVADVMWFIEQRDSAIRKAALEEAAKIMCKLCANGCLAERHSDGHYVHIIYEGRDRTIWDVPCNASDIRRAAQAGPSAAEPVQGEGG